jgi:uncharacterized membrane protein (UPF0127 family)
MTLQHKSVIYCISIAILILTFGLFVSACDNSKGPKVVIKNSQGKETRITVEIADTPEAREKGLMFREEMPENHGMLFLMPEESIQVFWMKNTPLPLDMLFIDHDWKIVGTIENATPYSTDPLSINKPSLYVLEVNGGFCSRHGINKGDSVELIKQ